MCMSVFLSLCMCTMWGPEEGIRSLELQLWTLRNRHRRMLRITVNYCPLPLALMFQSRRHTTGGIIWNRELILCPKFLWSVRMSVVGFCSWHYGVLSLWPFRGKPIFPCLSCGGGGRSKVRLTLGRGSFLGNVRSQG